VEQSSFVIVYTLRDTTRLQVFGVLNEVQTLSYLRHSCVQAVLFCLSILFTNKDTASVIYGYASSKQHYARADKTWYST